VVLAAELATISRISVRVLATRMGEYADSVNTSSIPHDLVVLAQPSTNGLVDAAKRQLPSIPEGSLNKSCQCRSRVCAANIPMVSRS
jgi:hypothetical protein